MNEAFPSPEIIGQFRQFGKLGPAYKVMAPIKALGNNDWLLLIQVAETGEEVEYKYSHAKKDPQVH